MQTAGIRDSERSAWLLISGGECRLCMPKFWRSDAAVHTAGRRSIRKLFLPDGFLSDPGERLVHIQGPSAVLIDKERNSNSAPLPDRIKDRILVSQPEKFPEIGRTRRNIHIVRLKAAALLNCLIIPAAAADL